MGQRARRGGAKKPPRLPGPHANLVRVLKSFFSITSFLKITNRAEIEMRVNFPAGLEVRRPRIV